jgi:hypothetical protein
MKRLMMECTNNLTKVVKTTGPHPANGITHWLNRARAESCLGMLSWELRELTPEEMSFPTASYILQGED